METMLETVPKPMTIEEFLAQPETKPAREYIDDRIIKKPIPQGKHSKIQWELLTTINSLALPPRHAHGFPELRCTFGGPSIVPDIVVLRWERIPLDDRGGVWSKPVDSSGAFPVAGSPQTPLKKGGFRKPPLLEGGVRGGSDATTFDHTHRGEVANVVPTHPDWIIEILSPGQSQTQVINKILHCLEHGCQLGWLIDPEERCVLVFFPGLSLRIFSSDEEVLPTPDFLEQLSLRSDRLFDWLKL